MIGVIEEIIDVESLKSYVLSKRAKDGGFAFCYPLPSSLPETYYAVFILKTLDEEIEEKEKLVSYLHSSLRMNPHSVYFVLKTLNLLNENLPDVSNFAIERLNKAMSRVVSSVSSEKLHEAESGVTATYSFDMPNVLREIHSLVTVLRLLKVKSREVEKAKKFIENFRKNGGYGVKNPNLEETYYCVSIKGGDDKVVKFVMDREWRDGGFCKVPNSYPPYIEDTYFAIECLYLSNYKYRDFRTLRYISELQNSDGGFRRSIYLGTSSLEFSYYAVASICRMINAGVFLP